MALAIQDRQMFLTSIWSKHRQLHRFLKLNLPWLVAEEAEDVVQDTYAAAVQNAEELGEKTNSGALGWLYTVARRKAIDRTRVLNAKKRGGDACQVDIEDDLHPAMMRTPSSFAAMSEGGQILRAAIERLSPRHRTAILCRYFEKLSYAETAKRLNISESAALMLTQRAIAKLRTIIGRESRVL